MKQQSPPPLPREVWGYISKQEANEAGSFFIGKANINGKEVVRVLQAEWVRDPTHSRLSQKTINQISNKENRWHKLPRKETKEVQKNARMLSQDSQIQKTRKLHRDKLDEETKDMDNPAEPPHFEGEDQDGKKYLLSREWVDLNLRVQGVRTFKELREVD